MNCRTSPWHRTSRSTWILTLVVALVACCWITAAPPASGATPEPAPQAAPALAWLAHELDAHGGTLPGFTPGTTEWGLTSDAVLAFGAAGAQDDPAAIAATDRIATDEAVTTYTTWDPAVPGVRVAGATAKVLLTLVSMDRPTIVDGVDLEVELRSLLVETGVRRGRFVDRVPDPAWDASNGFGQALAMLALAMTPGDVPAHAVDFLVAQQCPTGGFPLSYSTGGGCSDATAADPDASALAVQALLAVERTSPVRAALDRGVAWLLSRQGADGSFGGAGPTAGANANSTGVIGQTLRAAGVTEAADRAAGWITSQLQLDDAVVSGTPAAADRGAIAYATAARATALRDGITEASADQWRRATTQAVLALGLAPYGPHDVEPLGPVSTTTTITSTTSTPTTSTPTTSTVPTTTAPTTVALLTTPTTVPPSADGASPSSADTVHQGGAVAGSSATAPDASASGGALPRTGSGSDALVAAGVAAIGAGVMLQVTRRRRPRSTAGRR
jgi:LPXTG-motif cell wall-anchored protein